MSEQGVCFELWNPVQAVDIGLTACSFGLDLILCLLRDIPHKQLPIEASLAKIDISRHVRFMSGGLLFC